MSERDTKERILDAAERIFAERGFAGTSLRALTAEAGVNVAAVHYHFGSKEALLRATLHRRVGPVNQERLKRLDALEARPQDGAPTVEEVVEAFVAPAVRAGEDDAGGHWVRALAGRIYAEPRELVAHLMLEEFGEVSRRFVGALERALPGLSRVELEWRFQFAVGVIVFVVAERYVTHPPSGVELDATDLAALERRISAFLVSGLRAPSADTGAAS